MNNNPPSEIATGKRISFCFDSISVSVCCHCCHCLELLLLANKFTARKQV